MRASPGLVAFNSGELSPACESRTDIKQYTTGCFRLENFIPMVQGPVRRRPGTRFEAETKNSGLVFLMPFVFNVTESFMLEWGDHYLRFHQNHAPVTIESALGPNWNPTVGGTTADGALTWTNLGFPQWQPSTAYNLGDIIFDSNSKIQICTQAGTSLTPLFPGEHPIWNPFLGGITFDGTFFGGGVQWTNLGVPQWAPLTVFAALAVIYSPVGIQRVTAGGGGLSGVGTISSVAYEIPTPYAFTDLYDPNGFAQLDYVQSADVIYITHRSTKFPIYKLLHFGKTNWRLDRFTEFTGGPFGDANPGTNPIVFASGEDGTVTLTASADIFVPSIMGALFQLTEQNVRTIRPWESTKVVGKGKRRRFNGITYEAMNSGTTGTIPPTHISGEAWDNGDTAGIRWAYRDPGFGFVQLIGRGADPAGGTAVITGITAANPPVVTLATPPVFANGDLVFIKDVVGMVEVNDKFYRAANISGNTFQLHQDDIDGDGTGPNVDGTLWTPYASGGTVDNRLWTVTANVLEQPQAGTINRLPQAVVFSQNATSNWAVGAFNNRDGFPQTVSFFRGRLVFGRHGQVFLSVSADFENFSALTPGGLVTADMAISITLPTQDAIEWLVEGRVLVVGTASGEHVIQETNPSQPLGPANIASKAQMRHGSRAIKPTLIGYSLIWSQTSGQKVRLMKYQFFTDQYQSEDLAALANHIFEKNGPLTLAFQQEPDTVIWMIRNGNLK